MEDAEGLKLLAQQLTSFIFGCPGSCVLQAGFLQLQQMELPSGCSAQLSCGTWNLPGAVTKPMLPCIGNKFFITGPPGKSQILDILDVVKSEQSVVMCPQLLALGPRMAGVRVWQNIKATSSINSSLNTTSSPRAPVLTSSPAPIGAKSNTNQRLLDV